MILSNVNIGTGPSAGDGDTLRSAFSTINNNFQIVTNNVSALTNSVTSVAGRTGNIILTVNDVLSAASIAYVNSRTTGLAYGNADVITYLGNISGNLLPSANVTYSLGDSTHQWKELWVSGNTIYLGGIPLRISQNGDLVVNNSQVTGNLRITDTAISALPNTTVELQGKNLGGNVTAKVSVEPEYGIAKMEARSSTSTASFSKANNNWATGVWSDNGYGIGILTFTAASDLLYFFSNTLNGADTDTVSFTVNGLYTFVWDGGTSTDSLTGYIQLSTGNSLPPVVPTTINTIEFSYSFVSGIGVSYDNNQIYLNANGMGISINSTQNLSAYIDNNIDLNATGGLNISSSDILNMNGTAVIVNGGTDLSLRCSDDLTIESRSNVRPITVTTDSNGAEHTWQFNPDGTISFPDGGMLRVGNAPPTSVGESGNQMGEIAFDNDYIYYCTGPYDGSTNIWRRVALSQDSWPIA